MFDMNSDSHICESDLFTFMELHKDDEFYQNVMTQDLQDISQAIHRVNQKLAHEDKVMDYTDQGAPKIKDLEKYLEYTQSRVVQRREMER